MKIIKAWLRKVRERREREREKARRWSRALGAALADHNKKPLA